MEETNLVLPVGYSEATPPLRHGFAVLNRRFVSTRCVEEKTMDCVAHVVERNDLHLELTFGTGEQRLFDARPCLNRGVFARLQDPALFKQAYVAFDTVCWPGNLDIAPEILMTVR